MEPKPDTNPVSKKLGELFKKHAGKLPHVQLTAYPTFQKEKLPEQPERGGQAYIPPNQLQVKMELKPAGNPTGEILGRIVKCQTP